MPREPTGASGVRGAAADALAAILRSRGMAPPHLDRVSAGLDGRDRALLHELVLGSLRWLRRLDDVLERASGRPISRIDPGLLAPLRIGLYQLLFLDRVPAHAAVDEAVATVRRAGLERATGFVNAVLRRVARRPQLGSWPVEIADPLRRLAVETSHPDWLVARWVDRFGAERAARFLAASNRPRPPHLLAFRHRGGREALAASLAVEGVETRPSQLSPVGLVVLSGHPVATEAFRRGELYLQDEASQASALLPPPAAGERVLDAAAAPGGKGLAMLAWEPETRVVFADRSLPRLGTLVENLRRLGVERPVLACDAARPAVAGGFDRVVLDLPCSGTGTLRKSPELKWRLSPRRICSIALAARPLLDAAAALLVHGGRLVVITCSLEAEENEEAIDGLLSRAGGLRRQLDPEMLPGGTTSGVCGEGLWRVHPDDDHDGFTVHVLRRVSE